MLHIMTAEKMSEPAPETRSLTEGSPAYRGRVGEKETEEKSLRNLPGKV